MIGNNQSVVQEKPKKTKWIIESFFPFDSLKVIEFSDIPWTKNQFPGLITNNSHQATRERKRASIRNSDQKL